LTQSGQGGGMRVVLVQQQETQSSFEQTKKQYCEETWLLIFLTWLVRLDCKEEVQMKRMTSLIAALLVLSVGFPVHAAVNWGGSIDTSVRFHRDDFHSPGAFDARQEIKLAPNISAADVNIDLEWQTAVDAFSDNRLNDPDAKEESLFELTRATITVKGPFVQGGQELTTSIGDFKIGEDPKKGIRVEGISIADIDSTAYLIFNDSDNVEYRADFEKESEQVNWKGHISHANNRVDYIADGTIEASEALQLRGGLNSITSVNYVGANLEAPGNVEYDGQYNTDDTYRVRASKELGYAYQPVVSVGYADRGIEGSGANFGVEAVVEGVSVSAKYDQIGSRTEIKAGSGKVYELESLEDDDLVPFGYMAKLVNADEDTLTINGRFDLKDVTGLEKMSLAGVIDVDATVDNATVDLQKTLVGLEASTVADLAAFKGVELSGKAMLDLSGGNPVYEGRAAYEMPNGIEIDVSAGNSEDVNGFAVSASKTIEF
jgi:hypothetical protein